jgi:tRNA 2-selenouridine synthase SelU
VRPFKGIVCGDISEFESYMLSQAVLSLWAMSGLQKYVRMTHLLDRMRSAKGSRISYFARSRRQATREASLVAAWAIG